MTAEEQARTHAHEALVGCSRHAAVGAAGIAHGGEATAGGSAQLGQPFGLLRASAVGLGSEHFAEEHALVRLVRAAAARDALPWLPAALAGQRGGAAPTARGGAGAAAPRPAAPRPAAPRPAAPRGKKPRGAPRDAT